MPLTTVPSEQMVKPAEAAALLGVHPNTVRNWIKRGDVPFVKTPTGQYLLPWTLLAQSLRGSYDISIGVRQDITDDEAVERASR
jgi:excisionase family DNA binding protein